MCQTRIDSYWVMRILRKHFVFYWECHKNACGYALHKLVVRKIKSPEITLGLFFQPGTKLVNPKNPFCWKPQYTEQIINPFRVNLLLFWLWSIVTKLQGIFFQSTCSKLQVSILLKLLIPCIYFHDLNTSGRCRVTLKNVLLFSL